MKIENWGMGNLGNGGWGNGASGIRNGIWGMVTMNGMGWGEGIVFIGQRKKPIEHLPASNVPSTFP